MFPSDRCDTCSIRSVCIPENTRVYEEQVMSALRSIGPWVWHHRGRAVFLVVVIILVELIIGRPMWYQTTHFLAKDCGSLSTIGAYDTFRNQQNAAAAQQDIACFVQAHRQCSAATLNMVYQGVEGAGNVTFRAANGLGGCTISQIGYEEGFCTLPPVCKLAPYIDNDCRAIQQEADGLHFLDCGNLPDSVFYI
jgi:hypothetical protein